MRRVDSCRSAARTAPRATRRSSAAPGPPPGPRSRRRGRPRPRRPGGGERVGVAPRPRRRQVLQALEQRLLGVGDVEGVERRPRGHPSIASRCSADEPLGVLALEAGVDERGDRAGDDLHGLLELRGGAARGGRRVVELVREARGHLPERGEPLAVVLHAVDEVGDALHRPMTRRSTAGYSNARRRKSSGSMHAMRQSVSVRSRTRGGSPVRAAIAPIQVGACCRCTGSARAPWTESVRTSPSSRSCSPGGARRARRHHALRHLAYRRRPRPRRSSASSSSSSKRSIGRRSIAATVVIRRPGTGGRARRTSSPRRPRSRRA